MADCCASACDVFEAWHGIDPMRPLRGRYSGPVQAAQIITEAGGMATLAASLAAQAGLRPGIGGAGEIGVRDGCLVVAPAPGEWWGKTISGFSINRDVEVSWRA
ncbi:MAG: hypothetical protein CMJ32_10890 [Phycisphaerae bacterium]|nr:hypothetical protein [Phycisphaerae bacterium]